MKFLPLFLLILFQADQASAFFDPFTIAAVVSTASTAINGASEVAASAEAFQELYLEVDEGAKVSDGGERLTKQIKEVQEMAEDLGYTSDQIDSLTGDKKSEQQKLEAKIRAITNTIRAGKRIAKHFIKMERKADVAQIEATTIAEQQLSAQMELVYQGQERALEGIKAELKEEKRKADQVKGIREKLRLSGAKLFPKTKSLQFPSVRGIVDGALKTIKVIQPILLGFLFLAMALRIVYLQASFKEFHPLDVVKEALFCALFITFLPYLVQVILISSDTLAGALVKALPGTAGSQMDPNHAAPPTSLGMDHGTSSVADWLYHWVIYLAYMIADTIISITQGVLVIIMPIAVFLGVMFKMPILWSGAITGFAFISLWPFFWNCFGVMGELIWTTDADPMKTLICGAVVTTLQVVSPFFIDRIIKSQHAHGVASDGFRNLSRFAGNARQQGASMDKGVESGVSGEFKKAKGVAGTVGYVAGTLGSNAKSRLSETKKGFKGDGMSPGGMGAAARGLVLNNSSASFGARNVVKSFSRTSSEGMKNA